MSRYFAGAPGQTRTRRASDAMTAVIGLIVFLWAGLATERVLLVEQAVTDFFISFPEWFDQIYEIAYFSGLLYVVGLLIVVASRGRRRLEVLRDIGLAVLIAGVVLVIVHQRLYGEFPTLLPEFSDEIARFPTSRLVLLAAVVTVSAPSLARPFKNLGWWILGFVAIATIGLQYAPLGDVLGAIGLGIVAAGAVLLIFGSPGGYPSNEELVVALRALDVEATNLHLAEVQTWDARLINATDASGQPIHVKALGRDAAEGQLLNRMWRSIWYRDEPRSHGFGRSERVEHEALATLVARHEGVRTAGVIAVGIAGDDTAILVTTRPEGYVDPTSSTDLAAAWSEVGRLHDAGISHGNLTLASLGQSPEGPVLLGLGSANLNAKPRQTHIDVASLLFAAAVETDPAMSVQAAIDGLGSDRIAEALPYVQVPALSHAQKKSVKSPKVLLRQIANEIVEQTGTDPVPPERLRRVRPGDLVKPLLSLVAAYALIGMLGEIDFVAVWDVARNATWAWIVLGFFIGQLVFVPEATGMRYATGYDIVLRPLVVLQVSVKWIGLAVPSAAGRVAMNTAFLRKYGVPTTIAVSQGAIDGMSGFFVEAVILLVAFISADVAVDVNLDDVPWGLILVIVVFLVFAAVIAVLRIQRLRELILPVVKDAWQLLVGVLKSPSRIIGLLLSNLFARVILAIVLWLVLQAIGTPLPLITCLVATVATNLLAGIVPVPGGIGVAEAVMTTFLVFFGVDADSAFAAAVIFRICTFYIPAGEGFFAMQWLDKEGYI